MTEQDKENLVSTIVYHLQGTQKIIQLRQTALFYKAAQDYGARVAQGLGLNISDVEKFAAMTQE